MTILSILCQQKHHTKESEINKETDWWNQKTECEIFLPNFRRFMRLLCFSLQQWEFWAQSKSQLMLHSLYVFTLYIWSSCLHMEPV